MPSTPPADKDRDLAALVIGHLVAIMGGKCSITPELIAERMDDPVSCEILTGLLYLHEDLQLRDRELARQREQLDRTVRELWAEMDLARQIQTVLLPPDARLGAYEISAVTRPAVVVGGDYYDIIEGPSDPWVLIGDVSGHGVNAGLTMMMVQTAVRALVRHAARPDGSLSPSRLLTLLNDTIHENLQRMDGQQYMTITACALRADGIEYSGLHQDLHIFRAATGQIECLPSSGSWLGLIGSLEGVLSDGFVPLAPGDLALLHTDGMTEAERDGVLLGDEGMEALFQPLAAETSDGQTILRGLLAGVEDYTCDDDITLVLIRRT